MKGKTLGDMLDEVMDAIESVRAEVEELRETIAIGDLPRREPPEDPEQIIGEFYGPMGWEDEFGRAS